MLTTREYELYNAYEKNRELVVNWPHTSLPSKHGPNQETGNSSGTWRTLNTRPSYQGFLIFLDFKIFDDLSFSLVLTFEILFHFNDKKPFQLGSLKMDPSSTAWAQAGHLYSFFFGSIFSFNFLSQTLQILIYF